MNNLNLSPEAQAELKGEQGFLDKIGARSGQWEFTVRELRALFNAVANKENWKLPIACIVTVPGWREVSGTQEAIKFMTGSEAAVRVTVIDSRTGNLTISVKAAGYYAAIGA